MYANIEVLTKCRGKSHKHVGSTKLYLPNDGARIDATDTLTMYNHGERSLS